MQPELVNHHVSVFITCPHHSTPFSGFFGPKEATLGHCLEPVWVPVHEVHCCCLIPTVCGMRMCVKKVSSSGHLYLVQFTDECKVQNRPCLLLVSLHHSQAFSAKYVHLVRKSALLNSHVVKSGVTAPLRRRCCASGFSQRIVHTHPLVPFRYVL